MIKRIVMIWVFLVIFSQSGFGTTTSDPVDLSTIPLENVKEFLTADGRLDLEAAKRSGYEGALDFSGFAISFDPKTGEPLFLEKDKKSTLAEDDENWQDRPSPCGQGKGMNDVVRALTVYPADLIVGGTFTSAGCKPYPYLAGWNGTAWDSVTCGLQSGGLMEVRALTVYAGNLIVGGNFTAVGCWPGVPANCIAQWNGSNWSALGSGMSGGMPVTVVYALTVYGGQLIAGGNFHMAGGATANCIARWNGSSWSNLAQGMSAFFYLPMVFALEVYGSDLIAGGMFDTAGTARTNHIARWNGSTWLTMGSGMNNSVTALEVWGADLYAGGGFTQAGGTSANYIARWNGTTWSALGSGMSGGWITEVSALTVYGGELIAGGVFTHAGPVSVNHIARWNGGSWNSLGAGMFGTNYPGVYALIVYNNDLIAGGSFTYAGMNQANYIARWDGSSWSRVGYMCGDSNGDGVINSADIVHLVNYLFAGGPAPVPIESGDANADGVVDGADVVYLINYLFAGGPPPGGGKAAASGGDESELHKDAIPAQVEFSSPTISNDGILNVPVVGKFDVDLAAVQLEIKYNPEKISLLEPVLTPRTEALTIYYSSNQGIQKIDSLRSLQVGILDISGEHYVLAGIGALVSLRMKGSDWSSLEITKAILVDRDAQKIPVNLISEMKKSEKDFATGKIAVPQEFSLSQNYPNPFNPETEISYALPRDCQVKLTIYNIAGQKVRTLVDEHQVAGHKTIYWNGKDDKGNEVASGIYLYRIKAGNFSQSRKMMLVK